MAIKHRSVRSDRQCCIRSFAFFNLFSFDFITDTTYSDPLGPAAERPKTAATRRKADENDFEDEELGEDLLPV